MKEKNYFFFSTAERMSILIGQILEKGDGCSKTLQLSFSLPPHPLLSSVFILEEITGSWKLYF